MSKSKNLLKLLIIPVLGITVIVAAIFAKNATVQKSMSVSYNCYACQGGIQTVNYVCSTENPNTNNCSLTITSNCSSEPNCSAGVDVVCPAGKYVVKNTEYCTPCKEGYACAGGQFEPSASEDKGIVPCTGNTYSDETGLSECKTCYGNVNADHTACTFDDVVCPAGSYLPAGSQSCSLCELGHYCPMGTTYEPTTARDQGMAACTDNTYADVRGLTACKTCSGDVNADHTSCTPNASTITNIMCSAGKYLLANATSCNRDCEVGRYCPGGGPYTTSGSAQGIYYCEGNTYSDETGLSECKTCDGTVNSIHTTCTLDGDPSNPSNPSEPSGPEPVTGISVVPQTWLLGIGEQRTIIPTITPSNATNQNVNYSSNNIDVATVEPIEGTNRGMVTGVEVGESTITATTVDGEKTATSAITVVGSSTTKQIMNTRVNETLQRLINATEEEIHKNENIETDTFGNLLYPFGLGCKLGEENCYVNVSYEGYYSSYNDSENNGTLTIDQIKEQWNSKYDGKWDANGMNDGTATIAIPDIKNTYYAIYKNVGKYGDTNIDVKLTITDFEPMQDERYMASLPAITITKSQIGVAVTGIKWVKLKLEFLDSSDNSRKIVIKGNTTYWDIDLNQGVIVDSDNTNKGIFFVNNGVKGSDNVDNQLYYKYITDGLYVFDHNSGLVQTDVNPIYADDLNSTAYAFTEEFEGDTIVRTFQYSNPVFKNTANERVWNGHGAVFISSTPITVAIQHVVITEVENGTISPSMSVEDGKNATIKYSPNKGYELSEIFIDGQKVDLKGKTTSYTFENVITNHSIKVVYVVSNTKTGVFEVGGILLFVTLLAGTSYFLIRRKQISSI